MKLPNLPLLPIRPLKSKLTRLLRATVRSRRALLPAVLVLALLFGFGGWKFTHINHPTAHVKGASTNHPTSQPGQTQPQADTAAPTPEPTATTTATTAPSSSSPATSKPNASHVLVFSPASVTVYTNVSPSTRVLQQSTLASLSVSAGDGAKVGLPFSVASAGLVMANTPDPTPYKTVWPMQATGTFATPGTHTYTLTAKTATGVTYTGSVEVIVKAIPLFSTTATGFTFSVSGDATDIMFTAPGGGAATFDFSQVTGNDMPYLTIEVAGVSCTVPMDQSGTEPTCTGDENIDLPPGTYPATCVIENDWQSLQLSGTLSV
jgi:hypothetical protein